jgi:hypothetical protein
VTQGAGKLARRDRDPLSHFREAEIGRRLKSPSLVLRRPSFASLIHRWPSVAGSSRACAQARA